MAALGYVNTRETTLCICASATRKKTPAQVAKGSHHNAGRVLALVARMKNPPAQVTEGWRDRAPASIGASWSGMQQQHATCTWAQLQCKCPCANCMLLLHPAPTCTHRCMLVPGPPGFQQLVLVAFFIPATSANTLHALVVATFCNLRWWSFTLLK